MPHVLSERAPLLSPNPASSLLTLPSDDSGSSSSCGPSSSTTTKILPSASFSATCYVDVSTSIFANVFPLRAITHIRVALAGFMVMLLCQLFFWASVQGNIPPFLVFFEMGGICWILVTARNCLAAYWSTQVLSLSEEGCYHEDSSINLFFGIDGTTVDYFFWALDTFTETLSYFTTATYMTCILPLKANAQAVDYIHASVYMLLAPLALFESACLNCVYGHTGVKEIVRVSVFLVVPLYLNVWVPLGYSLMGEEHVERGTIDGRFLGGQKDLWWMLLPEAQAIIAGTWFFCDIIPSFVKRLKFFIDAEETSPLRGSRADRMNKRGISSAAFWRVFY